MVTRHIATAMFILLLPVPFDFSMFGVDIGFWFSGEVVWRLSVSVWGFVVRIISVDGKTSNTTRPRQNLFVSAPNPNPYVI